MDLFKIVAETSMLLLQTQDKFSRLIQVEIKLHMQIIHQLGKNGVPPASGTPASIAEFREIKSMAIDTSGTDDILYLVDQRLIKKINLTTNLVYYITGTNQTWQNSFTNGDFDEAFFGNIEDITVSNDGTSLYVLDQKCDS